jgi:ribonuclease BN (tRNA processing enzyme)
MESIQVNFLGAGNAFSPEGRAQASYLVRAPESTFLLDCGATILGSIHREGIDPRSIDTIFISHLHGDHFSGLPFLFLELTYENRRSRPLRIAGPPGTEERVRMLFQAMYRESAREPLPFRLEFTEMQPGSDLEFAGVRIRAFRVPHQEHEISLAFHVGLAGGTILYSGDTGWSDDLLRMSKNTDLFVCECTFFETRVSFHLDYPLIHENRGRIGSKRTILTHLGREPLARMNEIEMETAYDGLQIEL